jgi:hypothetical protein
MKGEYIFWNFILVFAVMTSLPFMEEFYMSTLLLMLMAYFVFYFVYLAINLFQIFIKGKKFNNRLLFFPISAFLVYVLYFYVIDGLYHAIDESIFSYISISGNGAIRCQEPSKCSIVSRNDPYNYIGGYIRIQRYIVKNYSFSYKGNCTSIYSPSYALVKFEYKKCY